MTDRTRRCRNFAVFVANGAGLFVKQPCDPSDAYTSTTLRSEGLALQRMAAHPSFRGVQPALPRFVWHDEADQILVTSLVQPAATLTNYRLAWTEDNDTALAARSAAWILARLHAAGRRALSRTADGFPMGTLPVVDAFHPTRGSDDGPLLLAYARRVRGEPALRRATASARRLWTRSEGAVHGDARWDNFLVTAGRGRDGCPLDMRLVDWEFCCRGDPAWDVATFLAEHLRFWLACAHTVASGRPVHRERAVLHLGVARSAAAAKLFLDAYAASSGLRPRSRSALLDRAGTYLPSALVQLGTELVAPAGSRFDASRVAVALAIQAAEDPQAFGKRWFGSGS